VASEDPIGIFDSGLGGLTVLKELQQMLPNETFIYVADTARVPFGSKTKSEIFEINDQIFNFLLKQDVKLIVIACNTSSAVALEHDKKLYDIPMIDMISHSLNGRKFRKNEVINILATQSTIKSKAYEKEINRKYPEVNIVGTPCPKLVPLIEAGKEDAKGIETALKEYLSGNDGSYTLLGCSHYPHLREEIVEIIGDEEKIINPAKSVAKQTRESLASLDKLNQDGGRGESEFYITGDVEDYKDKVKLLLGWQNINATKVNLLNN
jgi:glutamate racemase